MKMKRPVVFTNIINNISLLSQRLFYTMYCRLYKSFHTFFLIQLLYTIYYSSLAYIMGSKRKLEWKTHWQSPQCNAILKRKFLMSRSKSSLSWALINFSVAVLLLLDMSTNYITYNFIHYLSIIWYSELLIVLIVVCNAFTAGVFYIWSVFSKPIPISPVQQKLFGISEKDAGFEIKRVSNVTPEPKEKCMLFSSWRDSDCSFMSITPLNYSANSWASSPSYCLDSSSSSWTYYRPSSPSNYTSTPKSKHVDSCLTRKLVLSDSIDASFERPIKNSKQLEEFLKAYEEEDKKFKSVSLEESMSNVTSLDNSPLSLLGKCRYQRAYGLSNMETIEKDSSEGHHNDILYKLKISERMLVRWCERLRKWICQTILVKVVNEIDYINNSFSQSGVPEFQIGTVNLFALHQISVTKFQHLTSLTAVLPYLDMHLNQEYLVQRLRDLARGGCMGEFKWNSGGSYGDKQWCDDLPTDSAIIIHVLCCYLDAYLPPEPHFPEGKPFSFKHFKKTPEKLTVAKDLQIIYQSSLNPPHFKVVIGEDIYSLQKGRNNLFYTLLVFFYYLKAKECAMLGRVNLGPSGLNILWVFD